MEPTYIAQYRGFEFQCSPERLGDHAYAPRLVIVDTYESLTLEIPIGMPTLPFETPTAAAHQAFAHGRHWVDSGFSSAEPGPDKVPTLLQIVPLLPPTTTS